MHYLIGPGAVGGTLALHLHGAGQPVTLCVRTPMHTLSGEGPDHQLSAQLPTLTRPPAEVRSPTSVMLAVKAYDTASAAPWLEALTGPGTPVLVMQNGIEHVERVRSWVHPEAIVIPVMVDCPASRSAPGMIRWRRTPRLRVAAEPLGAEVVAWFDDTGVDAAISDDFEHALWEKLAVNAISGALPTLTRQPTGVFRRPEVAAMALEALQECALVARAEGVVLTEAWMQKVIAGLQGGDPQRRPSMLQDLEAGRPLEHDARNGAVVRRGTHHGVPTPINSMLNRLLRACDAQRSSP